MTNIETIQALYAAFGRGDVPAILSSFAPDAVISFEGASKDVPWHGPWRGHGEIQRFFGVLAEEVEFEIFEPQRFTASPEAVAVHLHLRYQVRRTGKRVDARQIHWWTMRDGKVAAIAHFEDTAQVVAATR
jgi:ketosteroid isomerase-like protein